MAEEKPVAEEKPAVEEKPTTASSDKKLLPAFLLVFFFGVFGAHRFYVGKTGTAVAMLLISLTLVGMIGTGVWAVIDMILILCSEFKDKEGNKLTEWN